MVAGLRVGEPSHVSGDVSGLTEIDNGVYRGTNHLLGFPEIPSGHSNERLSFPADGCQLHKAGVAG